MTAELVYLEKSSWSERALFALELAGVAFAKVAYTPFVDEAWLRLRLRDWTGRVSVPVLLLHGGAPARRGSRAIAEWAAEQGGLEMGGDSAYLDRIEAASERVMLASRYRGCVRVRDTGAFDESDVPDGAAQWLPHSLRRWVVIRGYSRLAAKYKRPNETMESDLADMRAGLAELRAMLRDAGGARFGTRGDADTPPSFADLIVATTMHFAPLPGGRNAFGPNVREQFREPELEVEFADLIAWRNALYEKFRNRR